MHILDRYLLRELARTVTVTTIVLLLVMLGTTFAQVLKQVADYSFPVGVMLEVLGLNMLDGLSTLLLLAGFIGALMALGRLHRESEMHVLAAAGIGPAGLLRPVALLAFMLVLLVGMVSLWLGPWAAASAARVIAMSNRSVLINGLGAGRFTELPGHNGIMRVDKLNPDQSQLGRTFIAIERTKQHGERWIKLVTGMRGRIEPGTDRHAYNLSLKKGWQYEIPLVGYHWRLMRYQRNDVVLPALTVNEGDSVHILDTLHLLHAKSDLAHAELAWRMVEPFMAWVLVMLALPMARQHPRESRFGQLLLAILVFYAYYLALGFCRAQIARGHWHHTGSLWGVSALVFACAAWLFRCQYRLRRPRRRGF